MTVFVHITVNAGATELDTLRPKTLRVKGLIFIVGGEYDWIAILSTALRA